MRLKQYLLEELSKSLYRWMFPTMKTIKSDFKEYKKKESTKWKRRANMLKARWPLFKDLEHFEDSLKNSRVFVLKDSMANRVQHLSNCRSIDELKALVSEYTRPRDVDRIVDGINNNDRIPYPIILTSNNRMFIMTGNTRINIARILKVPIKVLIVDVNDG